MLSKSLACFALGELEERILKVSIATYRVEALSVRACLVYCAIFWLGACGQDEAAVQQSTVVKTRYLEKVTPIVYHLDNPACTREQALADLGHVQIWVRNLQQQHQLVEVDLSGYGGVGLLGPGIVAAYGQGEWRELATEAGRGHLALENSGNPLFLCAHSGPYSVHSYENRTLASLASIAMAYRYYNGVRQAQSNLTSSINLPPVKLFIDAKVSHCAQKTTAELVCEYNVDNAFYAEGSSAYIVLTQASEQLRDTFLAQAQPYFHLHETLGVLAHEYGHLVFAHHTSALAGLVDAASDKQAVQRLLMAINEGWADLFAAAALQEEDPQQGRLIFYQNILERDVYSPLLDSGQRKRFIPAQLKAYTRMLDSAPERILDPHRVGAILAYNIALRERLFFSQSVLSHTAQRQQAGHKLLAWAEHLASGIVFTQWAETALTEPEESMRFLLSLFW